MPIELSVEQQNIARVAKALRAEADGRALRADLIKDMRAAAGPMVADMKRSIMSAGGHSHPGTALRPAIAASIKPAVRLSGRNTGISIRQTNTARVRGFRFAGRSFNRPSFRHRVYGSDHWVVQVGKPRWFDLAAVAHRGGVKRNVEQSVAEMASRIATKGGN